ncbi:MBL fold metallo-hydrolase [Streptomyces alkaliphilus]|uniref:MBL fold metallo-hydrolase n=1 Tax=Streptomyces alkaliphilus TaxID=1472722 RepID=A0A7W3Y1D7_9ACTN|nr:MBL fold metallo-hydrolase [Streptomyces alkaliphilus]MBB0244212.1 MBL fold metallo-hydrolase [Streptomyces alkaliphilus]
MTSTHSTSRLRRPSAVRRLRTGDHTLTHVPDGSVQLRPRQWFPGTGESDWVQHAAHLDTDGCLVGSIGGLLIEFGNRAMLIDAGFGPRRLAPGDSHPALGLLEGGRLPAELTALGVSPSRIERIAFTHLHDDHRGWAPPPGSGQPPTFPRAALLAGREEWRSAGVPGTALATATAAPDAVVPGRPYAVEPGEEIFPGVTTVPLPGHTTGHTGYLISSGDTRVLAFGDVMHSTIQLAHPDWHVLFDADAEQAVRTRHRVLEMLGESDTIGFGNHFADVVFGRLVSAPTEDTPRWEAAPTDP